MTHAFTAPIQPRLQEFEAHYKAALSSDNGTLVKMFDRVYQSSGKQMRPVLLLLIAELAGGVKQASLHAAVAVELLHLASLVHDDVVDEADMRRGKPSINALFDNKIAILGGDYILSSALATAMQTGQKEVIEVLVKLGMELCDGEILQYNNAKNRVFDEEAYFSVIDKKTAALFEACAVLGCITAGCTDKRTAEVARSFGKIAGRCFQIRDDIFDFTPKNGSGKTEAKDLDEGKATLPLIYIYNNADEACKKLILDAIDAHEVKTLQQMAKDMGGLDYAKAKQQELKNQALEQLSTLPDSDVRAALESYMSYITDREI